MKGYLTGLISGIILVILSLYIHCKLTQTEEPVMSVTTTQISGEEIKHSDVVIKKNILTFKTKSKGRGEIKTTIKIPYKKHNLQGCFILEDTKKIQLNYLYNISNRVALGGGVILGADSFKGIALVGQFKL